MPTTAEFQTRYGFAAHTIAPFGDSERAWRVDSERGLLVLRLHDPAHQAEYLANHQAELAALRYFERLDLRAPRLIPTAAGTPLTQWDGKTGYLTTFVPGEPLDRTPDNARDLGAAIARIHTLDATGAGLPDSHFSVAVRYRVFRQFDADPRVRAWAGYSAIRDRLVKAWAELPTMGELPRALIHSDLAWVNAVRHPTGELVLIDWEGSGVGPAIQDIGYFLTAYVRTWDDNAEHRKLARAFLAGYTGLRPLSGREWAHLPDAILFGTIFYVLWYSMVYQNGWQSTLYTLENRRLIERTLEALRQSLAE